MLIDVVNKILILIFFMSFLNTFRHVYYFIQALFTSTPEVPVKYKISKTSLLLLGASIAYLLMTLFTGVKL